MIKIALIFLTLTFVETDLAEQKEVLQQQLAESNQPGELHLKLSLVLQQLGELEASVSHAEQALEYLPESAPAHHRYSVALRAKMEKNPVSWLGGKKKYLGHLEQAIKLDKTFAPAYQELAGFNFSAPPFLGARDDAGLELGQELAKYDVKLGGQIMLTAYQRKGDQESELKTLTWLLAELPQDHELHYQMGSYLQGKEKYQESLNHFDPFSVGEDINRASLYQAARSRILGGFQLEKSIELLDLYISLVKPQESPTAADARWRQGVAQQGLKNYPQAEHYFKLALALDPSHKPAKKALTQLQ